MENKEPTTYYAKKRKKLKMMRIGALTTAALLAAVVIGALFTSQSAQRWLKSLKSEYTGGLQRTVTVYGPDGKAIRNWEGKVDIEENSYGNKVLFELDGKRKSVYNAVVIVEEE